MTQHNFSGQQLPALHLPLVGGGEAILGRATQQGHWQLVIVYRGQHCPICKKYLSQLESLKSAFADAGVELLALSGDNEDKARKMVEAAELSLPIAYDLSMEQMRELGLYISEPRTQETDQPFSEPGMFAVNPEGKTQLIDISNAPFLRPDLEELLDKIQWIQKNDYPIRGAHS